VGRPPRRVRRPPWPQRSVSSSFLSGTTLRPSGLKTPWAPGIRLSGLESPRPTRSRAYASATVSPRSPQGSLPTCWARALVGRDSHPLDSEPSFMPSSHTLTPLGPALPGRTFSCAAGADRQREATRPRRQNGTMFREDSARGVSCKAVLGGAPHYFPGSDPQPGASSAELSAWSLNTRSAWARSCWARSNEGSSSSALSNHSSDSSARPNLRRATPLLKTYSSESGKYERQVSNIWSADSLSSSRISRRAWTPRL